MFGTFVHYGRLKSQNISFHRFPNGPIKMFACETSNHFRMYCNFTPLTRLFWLVKRTYPWFWSKRKTLKPTARLTIFDFPTTHKTKQGYPVCTKAEVVEKPQRYGDFSWRYTIIFSYTFKMAVSNCTLVVSYLKLGIKNTIWIKRFFVWAAFAFNRWRELLKLTLSCNFKADISIVTLLQGYGVRLSTRLITLQHAKQKSVLNIENFFFCLLNKVARIWQLCINFKMKWFWFNLIYFHVISLISKVNRTMI